MFRGVECSSDFVILVAGWQNGDVEDRSWDLERKDYRPALSHHPKPLKRWEYLRQQGCGLCIVAVRLYDEESNYRRQLCHICYDMLVHDPTSRTANDKARQ
jgi:hypothetical protein